MEETISRMAGSEHGSAKTVAELTEIAAGIGRPGPPADDDVRRPRGAGLRCRGCRGSASCSGSGSSPVDGCANAAAGSPTPEFFWEPAPDCWNIRPDEHHVGGWSYEYEFAPAEPAPVTTLGWRLVHITAGNRVYWNHAFGDGTLTFLDLIVPHTAADAIEVWAESRRPVTAWLADATDADLARCARPTCPSARWPPASRCARWSTSRSTTAPRSRCCATCSSAPSPPRAISPV